MEPHKHYSKEFKIEAVKKGFNRANKDPELSVITITKEYYPSIPVRLVYTCLQKLKEEVRKELETNSSIAKCRQVSLKKNLLKQKFDTDAMKEPFFHLIWLK